MPATQLDIDARLIAAHIQNGDIEQAKNLFDVCIKDLKHFEASALRDRIHTAVEDLAQSRGEPNYIFNNRSC